MRIFTKTFGFLIAVGFAQLTFAMGNIFVSVNDIVAGEPANVRIAGLMADENVGIKLTRPDKTNILFSKKADDEGVLDTKIFALHLRKAGDYELALSRTFGSGADIIKNFSVLAGTPSAYKTKITLHDASVAADGKQEAVFIVRVADAYDNPVSGVRVQVVSSRNEDLVLTRKVSNQNGEVEGIVKSKTPGISTLSVLVGDTVVYDKPEIVFYLSGKEIGNVGAPDLGRFLKAQLFDDSNYQEIAYFSIENLPNEVLMDKRYSFKVIAKDEDGNVVPNYLGKVRFASSDNQSTLPADYDFDETDQGAHTFALSIIFGSKGEHTLTVHDTGDFRIAGEATVTVVDGSTTGIGNDEEAGITILTPVPGTFRSSRVTITGKAIGTQYVKIEDGPTELIDELEVDTGGEFVYQTPALADGTHKFRVSSSPDGEIVSQEVTITIDQSPPTVMLVELLPRKKMSPDEAFSISVASNEPLSSAKCILNEVETPLSLSGDKFIGTFQAPRACGVYPISCTITDLLGNELSEPNAEALQVCNSDGSQGNPSTGIAPMAVMNLSAVPEKNKVTLNWSPAKDDRVVEKYRILFGKEKQKLNEFNTTPDNRTQWYIDNLEQGTTYYFQVMAIDDEGLVGAGSNIVQTTTLGKNLHASAPRDVPTSGGNHLIPAVIALFVGALFLVIVRRRA